ncbi:hypothetical protein [Oharaeibacter diazotrophicus]|uniref:Uncharacterized protein n=1 Tax=Oharaeibacter diazotrophicus TaxID=1920512 RepID=A0A4R6RM41_9HYPH|nr:hypothetical protein [Oharaeibacter diazotrophicus]TDP86826.1 hypothetical protein EDD54_0710 [Oharaeibacter diazotrophicus]BBE71231.1 hypothetical protein OHA_1_00801 [Pleomorphomonas sp. SM30]GLS77985.1 hypothetical protein GCM10007904_33220 [Oharaeibacter diazotrophicus]
MRFATLLAGITLAAALPAAAAEPVAGPAAAAAVQASGVFAVTAVVSVNASIPDGTTLTGAATANVGDPKFSNYSSVSLTGVVKNRKVTLTGKVPYLWALSSRGANVTVSVSAYSYRFASGDTLSYSTYVYKSIALPKNGATTKVALFGAM